MWILLISQNTTITIQIQKNLTTTTMARGYKPKCHHYNKKVYIINPDKPKYCYNNENIGSAIIELRVRGAHLSLHSTTCTWLRMLSTVCSHRRPLTDLPQTGRTRDWEKVQAKYNIQCSTIYTATCVFYNPNN